MGIEKEVEIWYAMRATYRREPDAMHLLKKENLGCFIPMQYKICIKKRKKVRALVPVVHNLLFVHAPTYLRKRLHLSIMASLILKVEVSVYLQPIRLG